MFQDRMALLRATRVALEPLWFLYEGAKTEVAALLIEATTDNANRTVAEIRHVFQRHGGLDAQVGHRAEERRTAQRTLRGQGHQSGIGDFRF